MLRLTGFLQRTGARLAQRDSIYVGIWLTVILATEIAGRGTTDSDAQDLLGVALWGALIAVTLLDHARKPLRLVSKTVAFVKRCARRVPLRGYSMGLDLRGAPPLPTSMPRASEAGLWVAVTLCSIAWLVRDWLPESLREVLLGLSPTVWFLTLGVLWAVTVFACVTLFQASLVLLSELTGASPGLHARRSSALLAMLTLLVLALVFPMKLGLVLSGVSALALLVASAWPNNPRMSLVFVDHSQRDELSVLQWTQFLGARTLSGSLGIAALLLVLLGDPMHFHALDTSMPLTQILGVCLVWILTGATVSMALHVIKEIVEARREDSSGPDRPRLFLEHVAESDRAATREALQSLGFESEFEARNACATDVRATWPSSALGAEPPGPFALTQKHLADEGFLERLRVRHATLCRRQLRKGLKEVFAGIDPDPSDSGAGYWLAPHLWFFEGLRRDSEEAGGRFQKPHFRDVLEPSTRRHLHHVLKSLEVDLLFVEDGIDYAKFEPVLQRLFRVYDAPAVTGRLEEFQLSGVSGVRVVLHDHDFDTPLRSGNHTRPDYRYLGRARILHVFRDRGGDSDSPVTPEAWDYVPDVLPALF